MERTGEPENLLTGWYTGRKRNKAKLGTSQQTVKRPGGAGGNKEGHDLKKKENKPAKVKKKGSTPAVFFFLVLHKRKGLASPK